MGVRRRSALCRGQSCAPLLPGFGPPPPALTTPGGGAPGCGRSLQAAAVPGRAGSWRSAGTYRRDAQRSQPPLPAAPPPPRHCAPSPFTHSPAALSRGAMPGRGDLRTVREAAALPPPARTAGKIPAEREKLHGRGRPQNTGMGHHPPAAAFRDATTFSPQRSSRLSLISPRMARLEAGLEKEMSCTTPEVPPQLPVGGQKAAGAPQHGAPTLDPQLGGAARHFPLHSNTLQGKCRGRDYRRHRSALRRGSAHSPFSPEAFPAAPLAPNPTCTGVSRSPPGPVGPPMPPASPAPSPPAAQRVRGPSGAFMTLVGWAHPHLNCVNPYPAAPHAGGRCGGDLPPQIVINRAWEMQRDTVQLPLEHLGGFTVLVHFGSGAGSTSLKLRPHSPLTTFSHCLLVPLEMQNAGRNGNASHPLCWKQPLSAQPCTEGLGAKRH